jgi:hypothetical protein
VCFKTAIICIIQNIKIKIMKKEFIIGGLALVGAIALYAWFSKPKTNEQGFLNATGGCGCGA